MKIGAAPYLGWELGVQKSLGPMLCGWNLGKFGLGKVIQNRKLRLNFPIPSRNPCAIRNPCPSRNPRPSRNPHLSRNPRWIRNPHSSRNPSSIRNPSLIRNPNLFQVFSFVHSFCSKHVRFIPSPTLLQKAPKCTLLLRRPFKPTNTRN